MAENPRVRPRGPKSVRQLKAEVHGMQILIRSMREGRAVVDKLIQFSVSTSCATVAMWWGNPYTNE